MKKLKLIVERRLKNARANATAVGIETITGKMFTGKAELLENILEEYKALDVTESTKEDWMNSKERKEYEAAKKMGFDCK